MNGVNFKKLLEYENLFITYMLIAVITFGHSYKNIEEPEVVFMSKDEMKVIEALVCSFTWPLYWSVQGWK